jgi:hypothetical protein
LHLDVYHLAHSNAALSTKFSMMMDGCRNLTDSTMQLLSALLFCFMLLKKMQSRNEHIRLNSAMKACYNTDHTISICCKLPKTVDNTCKKEIEHKTGNVPPSFAPGLGALHRLHSVLHPKFWLPQFLQISKQLHAPWEHIYMLLY